MLRTGGQHGGRALLSAVRKQQPAAQSAGACRILSSYTERQNKKGRPVSPHVTVYRFPAVALSSIANRVTGVAMVGGLYGLGFMSLAGGDAPAFVSMLGESAVGPIVKFSASFPLIYHYLGSVRHAVWDRMPETVYNESVEKSSYALFGISAALSVGLACV
eukprot:7737-Heterococcus_DN1.PRE.3